MLGTRVSSFWTQTSGSLKKLSLEQYRASWHGSTQPPRSLDTCTVSEEDCNDQNLTFRRFWAEPSDLISIPGAFLGPLGASAPSAPLQMRSGALGASEAGQPALPTMDGGIICPIKKCNPIPKKSRCANLFLKNGPHTRAVQECLKRTAYNAQVLRVKRMRKMHVVL